MEQFALIDVDGNGVLTSDELFPVIEDLVQCPWAITPEHCNQFVEVFDEDGDGVIDMGEFHTFIMFVTLMSYLEYQNEVAQEELEDAAELTEVNEGLSGWVAGWLVGWASGWLVGWASGSFVVFFR